MPIGFDINAADFARLGHDFNRLPAEVKQVVFARAFRRVGTMTRTRVIRHNAKRIKIPQKHVRKRTSKLQGTGGTRRIRVESGWISLGELGARQGARGILTPGRSQVRSGFMATVGGGHRNAFRRVGAARLPIQKLYGPNPANDIATSPRVYEALLQDVMKSHMAKRMLHELTRILPD
ncbi:MAG: phage tail protein [Pseudomonadota bacterium]